jgi:hypothetical protein
MRQFLTFLFSLILVSSTFAQQPPPPPTPPLVAGISVGGTGIVINPTPLSLAMGINDNQTGPTTGGQVSQFYYNNFSVNSDNYNISGGAGNNSDAMLIFYNYGGSNMQGARNGLYVSTNLAAASRSGDNNPSYAAISALATASVNNNGTNTGGGSIGALSAVDGFVNATAAATNYRSVTAAEFDLQCLAGCTASGMFGVLTVRYGTGGPGATNDAAIGITSLTGATKWTNGILFTNWSGQGPVATAGCLICTDGNSNTVATGMDLSAYTLTNFLKGPNGFVVTGGASGSVNNPSPVLTLGSYFQTGNNCVSHLALEGTTYGFGVSNAGNVIQCSAGGFWFQVNGNGISATPALQLNSDNSARFGAGVTSVGTPPTTTGSTCTIGAQLGGATMGSVVVTCTAQSLVLNFATTAPNFWQCNAEDISTPADLIRQTARGTTSATFATLTTAATDVLQFNCFAY